MHWMLKNTDVSMCGLCMHIYINYLIVHFGHLFSTDLLLRGLKIESK